MAAVHVPSPTSWHLLPQWLRLSHDLVTLTVWLASGDTAGSRRVWKLLSPEGLYGCHPFSVMEGLAEWLAGKQGQTLVYLKATKLVNIFKVFVVLFLFLTLKLIFTFEN